MAGSMRGVKAVKRQVAAFFEEKMPAYLDALRVEWELDEEQLKVPAAFLPNEPSKLDRWPLLAVSSARKLRMRPIDVQPLSTEYESTYQVRVHVWVNVKEWDAVISERDDLTTAVTQMLVDYQRVSADDTMVVRDGTVVEEYSDVAKVGGDRHVAGAMVAFDLRVFETVTRTPDGTVATTELETELLEHPALT